MDKDIEIIEGGIIFFEIEERNAPIMKATVDGLALDDYAQSMMCKPSNLDSLGSCRILLDNPKGYWNNKWEGGEQILIYLDNKDGTTLQFDGKVDVASPGFDTSYAFQITGRAYPEMVDNTAVIEFEDTLIHEAIKTVVDNLNDLIGYTVISYTTSSIETTTETVSYKFREQNYVQILKDLYKRAGFVSNISSSGVLSAFTKGTKKLDTCKIVMGINVLRPGFFSHDNNDIRNVQKVYGNNKEDCLVMWTKKLDTLTPWRKERITNDNSIETVQEAKDKADSEMGWDVKQIKGNPTILGEPELLVGYDVDVFLPYVFDGTSNIQDYTHRWSLREGYETDVVLARRTVSPIIRLKEAERRIHNNQNFFNPNNMSWSAHLVFDDESQIENKSNILVENGLLKLDKANGDSGNIRTVSFTFPETVNFAELRYSGEKDNALTVFEVSCDDGKEGTFQSITPGTGDGSPGDQLAITTPGKKIVVKVFFTSNTENPVPTIKSLAVYGKE